MIIAMRPSQTTYVPEVRCDIDAGCASLVSCLNKAGYLTVYCCSGLWEDHMNITCFGKRNDFQWSHIVEDIDPHPYISFPFRRLTLEQITAIARAARKSGASVKCSIAGRPLRLDVELEFWDHHDAYLDQMIKEAEALARHSKKSREKILIKLIKEGGNPNSELAIKRFWTRFEKALLKSNRK